MKNFPLIVTISAEKEVPVGYKVLKYTKTGTKIVIRDNAMYMVKEIA